MRVVYSSEHLHHTPLHEYADGEAIANFEVPERVEAIRTALLDDGGFAFDDPAEHGTAAITAVHDPGLLAYLETVWERWRAAGELGSEIIPDTFRLTAYREGMGEGRSPRNARASVGMWVFDSATPIVEGSYGAARAAVDVALTAADIVLDGERFAYGLCRPPGHHAARAMSGGYCFFNNAAIVAEEIAARTGGRVAILDVDYHHGNGTQQIFYARGEVQFVSLHGDPDRAYPYYSGFADETGAGDGEGATMNLPLPAGCSNEAYLEQLDRGLEAIVAAEPGLVVVSLGIDTYERDPICDLALTTEAYHAAGERTAALGLPVVVLQEGGYFVPHLGQNVRNWLLGLEGREADLSRLDQP